MAALELRPMGIGDILDTSFRLYRARFLTFLTITLMAYIPYGLVMGIFQTTFGLTQQNPFGAGGSGGIQGRILGMDGRFVFAQVGQGGQFEPQAPIQFSPGAIIAGSLGTLLFILIVMPLCQGALMQNISASYLGEDLSAASSYARAAPRLLKMLFAQFLAGLVIMLGCILLIVPGIIFAFWFSLVQQVVQLEDQGVLASLSRSRELMRGNFGKAFGLGIVVTIIGMVFSYVVGIGTLLIPWPHPFLPAFVNSVLPAVILPIQLAPAILLYYDIRIRKEAFDLQQLASQLGKPAII
jgi:hypothetical protein